MVEREGRFMLGSRLPGRPRSGTQPSPSNTHTYGRFRYFSATSSP